MSFIHNLLVIGNSLLITGGSMLAGGHSNVHQLNANLVNEKVMRVVGQSIFLLVNVYLLYCIFRVIKECKLENKGVVHPTLRILLAIWPLLIIRGIYGVLAAVVPALNYFNFANYTAYGLKDAFVISEYILGTTMEWTSCALLILTWVTSRHDPRYDPKKEKWKDELIVMA
jgi:hypothetical protein